MKSSAFLTVRVVAAVTFIAVASVTWAIADQGNISIFGKSEIKTATTAVADVRGAENAGQNTEAGSGTSLSPRGSGPHPYGGPSENANSSQLNLSEGGNIAGSETTATANTAISEAVNHHDQGVSDGQATAPVPGSDASSLAPSTSEIASAENSITFLAGVGMAGNAAGASSGTQPASTSAMLASADTSEQPAYLRTAACLSDFCEKQSNLALHSSDIAAPVPEPETYALMAAGLLTIIFLVRRRRKE